MDATITSLPTAVRRRLANGPVYYGWIVVGMCFLISVITWGTIWSFGVFFGYFVDEFGLSHANTSIIFSLHSFVVAGGGAVLGFVIDRYGSRLLLLVATGFVTLGLYGASQLGSFTGLFLSYGLVVGAGFAIESVVEKATPNRWFDRRRGFATGLAGAGAGVGIFLLPPILDRLIIELGWRGAYGSLIVTFLVIYVLAALLISSRPDELDLNPSKEFPTGIPDQPSSLPGWRSQFNDVLNIARKRAYVLVFLGTLFTGITLFVMLTTIVEFTTNIELGREIGVLAISVMGAMNIAGKVVGGVVSDRVGRPISYGSSGLFMGVGIAILFGVSASTGVLAAVVVFGFGWGINQGLLAPTISDLFGTLSINALFGLVWSAYAIAGLLGPYFSGLTFDLIGTFRPAFLGAAVISIIGSGFVFLATRLESRDSTVMAT